MATWLLRHWNVLISTHCPCQLIWSIWPQGPQEGTTEETNLLPASWQNTAVYTRPQCHVLIVGQALLGKITLLAVVLVYRKACAWCLSGCSSRGWDCLLRASPRVALIALQGTIAVQYFEYHPSLLYVYANHCMQTNEQGWTICITVQLLKGSHTSKLVQKNLK